MSRLIVISNRVSAPTGDNQGAQGGLAVALGAALREYRGIWFGWSGKEVKKFTGAINMERAHGVTVATVDLEKQDIDEYYNGYANRTLWPLFHYRIDLTEYDRSFGSGYERVNERFAETVAPLIEPDDLVWIHDYHLIPLGRQLRQRGLKNRIGLFLHIPWPPRHLMVSLPYHQRLVDSMLAYDLIGFQNEEWLESFRQYLTREMDGTIGEDGVAEVGEHKVETRAFPIGIDYKEFMAAAGSDEAHDAYERLRKSASGRKVIIGVDRLDYSKGLEERFQGYQRFLKRFPKFQEKLFLLQIAPPSRAKVETYRKIRETLDELSGRINGEYAEIDWVPIRYVNRGYARAELAGLYRAAAIGLVTPLRDGMNLVAKEYVAVQNPKDPGVLVLSRFAGAADQLTEAVMINPYSRDDVADGIKTALEMPKAERIRRWEKIAQNVEEEDVIAWRHAFVEALAGQ
ncbi:MAG: alpha,alpha-trehalose-phosphate synthase (UDP-forming) [Sphingomonadaceae bacterium]